MAKVHNPPEIMAPGGRYSHGIEVPPNARWLYVSGQVGGERDGSIPPGVGPQTEICWRNIKAILASAGMDLGDIVKVTVFLTREDDVGAYRDARDRIIGDYRPASTLVVVSRLVKPEWVVEVEVVAARA